MTYMNRILYLLMAAGLIFCSCSKSVTPAISLSQHSVSFPSTGGTTKAAVTCNCTWVADCEVEGVMIAPVSYNGSCNVSITVPPTSSKVTTSVPVTFTATGGDKKATAKFVVTLQPKAYLEIPQASATIYVPAAANGCRLNIESNQEWEYVYSTANKSLSITPQSGYCSQEVTVSFPDATVTRNKTFNLTFQLKDDTSVRVVVKIIQYGKK